MNFLNKRSVWVAITLIFSICLTTCAGMALLDVFVVESDLDEDIIVEQIDFSGGSGAVNENLLERETTFSEETPQNKKETSSMESSEVLSPVNADIAKYILLTKEIGSYANDNASISVFEKIFTVGKDKTTYFVVDIKVSSVEYLKTALASGDEKLTVNKTETVADMAKAKNAIFAINGDGCGQSKRSTGYVVRNGVTYRSAARKSSGDTEALVVYGDGSMGIIDETKTALDSVVNKWQVFSFGPALINNGAISVTEKQEISGQSMADNPRTAIGMVKPLHYVIIVGNGRTNESKGLTLYQLALALAYEGCTVGYNLDGGGSSTLWFNGKVINYPTTNGRYSEREVSDIVYIQS